MLVRHVAAVLNRPANAQLLKRPAYVYATRLTIRGAPIAHRRLYATPSRPKKAVGETSRPIKRSPKTAATPSDATLTAQQSKTVAAAKKEKAKEKKKAADAKKKQKAAERKAAAAEKKAKTALAKKTKAAAVKARAAAKKKKQQEKIAGSKASRSEISELKKKALDPPRVTSMHAWLAYVKENYAAVAEKNSNVGDSRERLQRTSRELSTAFKELGPAEREHYNHNANIANDEAQAARRQWVKSHTPEEILLANKARATLRRKQPNKRWRDIEDDRAVKLPATPYIMFMRDRNTSGDLAHIAFADRAKLVAQQWKDLTEGEKKKYFDLHAQDLQRYASECNQVYGHQPAFLRPRDHSATQSAAGL